MRLLWSNFLDPRREVRKTYESMGQYQGMFHIMFQTLDLGFYFHSSFFTASPSQDYDQ